VIASRDVSAMDTATVSHSLLWIGCCPKTLTDVHAQNEAGGLSEGRWDTLVRNHASNDATRLLREEELPYHEELEPPSSRALGRASTIAFEGRERG